MSQLLHRMKDLYKEKPPRLTQPIFAVHSIHDESAMVEGIVELFEYAPGNRQLLILSDPKVAHASVVLEHDIQLAATAAVPGGVGGQEEEAPKNPKFEGMMKAAIGFFEEFVRQ